MIKFSDNIVNFQLWLNLQEFEKQNNIFFPFMFLYVLVYDFK
jgi:hypothetical protein